MKITKEKELKIMGFTLIEVLIFTAVSGIFIVLTFSLLTSFFRSRNRARKLSTLQEASTYILNQLTQEAHWGDEVVITQNDPLDELRLIQTQPDETSEEIVFRVQGGRFLKDNAPLSPPEVTVNEFQVNNLALEDQIPCLEFQLGLEYTDSTPLLLTETKTTISLRKTHYQPTFNE